MPPPAPSAAVDAVRRFNACINAADLSGLAALMTEDHRLVDTTGAVVAGKGAVLAAWAAFFTAFPDYRNRFRRWQPGGDAVAVEGDSLCSDPRLSGPVLWRATVRDGRVAEWRVLVDRAETRAELGL